MHNFRTWMEWKNVGAGRARLLHRFSSSSALCITINYSFFLFEICEKSHCFMQTRKKNSCSLLINSWLRCISCAPFFFLSCSSWWCAGIVSFKRAQQASSNIMHTIYTILWIRCNNLLFAARRNGRWNERLPTFSISPSRVFYAWFCCLNESVIIKFAPKCSALRIYISSFLCLFNLCLIFFSREDNSSDLLPQLDCDFLCCLALWENY